jgi:superkiller protein 3
MVTSEAGGLPPNPEAADAQRPVTSGKRVGRDYWIAGLIVLVIAGFAGRDFVSRIFSAGASLPLGGTSPAAANEHIGAGMASYSASDFTKAEAEFRKAAQSDPNSALAYNDLGAALNSQKRWDEAIAVLRRALELNPALELAKNNLAYAYSQKAHADGRTSPEAAQAANEHIGAGMAFYNASDFTKAEAEFRQAVQADPGSALAYNDLGAALNSQKRWDEAIAALQKAIELNPTLELAKNNLAQALTQKAGGGDGRK